MGGMFMQTNKRRLEQAVRPALDEESEEVVRPALNGQLTINQR